MGCCTYFRKTWWPGYNSDVIDPNKAFECDRWLKRIRRMMVTVLVLALLIGSVFLVWRYTSTDPSPLESQSVNSSSSASSITSNSSSLPQPAQEEDHPKAELHKGSIFNTDSFLKSTTYPSITTTKTEESPPPPIKEDHDTVSFNGSVEVADFNLTSSNLTNTATSSEELSSPTNATSQVEDRIEWDPAYAVDYGNLPETTPTSTTTLSTSESPPSSSSSSTTTHVPASSGEWCASKENTMECVALTKNFRMLTTFHNGSVKHNDSAEGYIMVKLKNSTWHPYCYPHWTLEMGYKLCHSLGFRRLIQLQTIDISQLQKRISQKFGREKVPVPVMRADNLSEKAAQKDMLVLTGSTEASGGGGSSAVLKTVSSQQFSCEAGFISCLN